MRPISQPSGPARGRRSGLLPGLALPGLEGHHVVDPAVHEGHRPRRARGCRRRAGRARPRPAPPTSVARLVYQLPSREASPSAVQMASARLPQEARAEPRVLRQGEQRGRAAQRLAVVHRRDPRLDGGGDAVAHPRRRAAPRAWRGPSPGRPRGAIRRRGRARRGGPRRAPRPASPRPRGRRRGRPRRTSRRRGRGAGWPRSSASRVGSIGWGTGVVPPGRAGPSDRRRGRAACEAWTGWTRGGGC